MKRFARPTAFAVTVCVAAAVIAIAVLALPNRLTFVTTHGVSMNPTYYEGDLVVVAKSDSYRVGEIVAYRVPSRHLVVLHRLTGIDHGTYTFKGDNNESVDPWHPTAGQLVGRPVLHVPHGGRWLRPLIALTLCLVTLAVLFAGAGHAAGPNRRKRALSHNPRHSRREAVAGGRPLRDQLRICGGIAASVSLAGLALAGFAWASPSEQTASVHTSHDRRMDFSYSASVGRTAAYDGTVARSPDPLFLRVARTAVVRFNYIGPAGTITVSARMSAANGWHSERALLGPTAVTAQRSTFSVRLDLADLQARAEAAAAATAMPMPTIDVSLLPRVRSATGSTFAPALHLVLTRSQLLLSGGRQTLSASEIVPVAEHVRRHREFVVLGHRVSVDSLRAWSALVVGGGALGAAAVAVVARRSRVTAS